MLPLQGEPWALPPELLCKVFECLPFHTLATVARVSRQWRVNAQSPAVWKHLELTLGGTALLSWVAQPKKGDLSQGRSVIVPVSPGFLRGFADRLAHVQALTHCAQVFGPFCPRTLAALAARLPNLQKLDMTAVDAHALTPARLRTIAQGLPRLAVLILNKCPSLTDNHLCTILAACTALDRLAFSHTRHVTELSLQMVFGDSPHQLTTLDAHILSGIDRRGWRAVFSTWQASRAAGRHPALTRVSLCGSSDIMYQDLACLSAPLARASAPLCLDLRDCEHLTRQDCRTLEAASQGGLFIIDNARLSSHSVEGIKEFLQSIMAATA